ncbi:MAG: anaerobic glycerol-3-phosphate dehydrogenase subunit GlpA [Thermodesulfobacteriota bacterium]
MIRETAMPHHDSSGPARLETQVLIIGGGATGTGLARDLALRGVHCVLAEKEDINAGASGANHGLLHSGARYVASDIEAARECRTEGELLKRLAPHCVEENGGMFVAVEGDNEQYIADFPNMCAACGIPTREIDVATARELEPVLSSRLIAAHLVEDASIDPFRLSLENIAHARQLGCVFLRDTEVVSFHRPKGIIESALLRNRKTGEETTVVLDQVINAAGAWAGHVASLAGIHMDMIYSKGTLLVTQKRLTRRVINRLRPATDADILVPGGTVSILGTTSVRVASPEGVRPTVAEVDLIIDQGAAMAPVLESTRYIRAYAGVRPLFGSRKEGGDRSVSRGFALLDHAENGIENFITITGGKLTTFRLMAEKTADLVCRHLGISAACETARLPLPKTESSQWTEPGLAPKIWLRHRDPTDHLLCECDMVPKSVVESIASELVRCGGGLDVNALALRSRIGKGPCQGAYCSVRVTAHLYDCGLLSGNQGLPLLREFLRERWLGQHPLLWDLPLAQSELMQAIHCGFFGIDRDAAGGRE